MKGLRKQNAPRLLLQDSFHLMWGGGLSTLALEPGPGDWSPGQGCMSHVLRQVRILLLGNLHSAASICSHFATTNGLPALWRLGSLFFIQYTAARLLLRETTGGINHLLPLYAWISLLHLQRGTECMAAVYPGKGTNGGFLFPKWIAVVREPHPNQDCAGGRGLSPLFSSCLCQGWEANPIAVYWIGNTNVSFTHILSITFGWPQEE